VVGDWTVPFDDMLTMRFTTCIFCSHRAQWAELRDTDSGYAMSVVVCFPCKRVAGAEERLQALVDARAQQWQC
jgi:hypothetical protein